MPICDDPEKTFTYTLRSDRERNPPPTFVFRYLTYRKWRQVWEALTTLSDESEGIDKVEDLFVLLDDHIVRCENMNGHEGDFRDILTTKEASELLAGALQNSEPGADDLGKSDSPP